MVTALLCTSLLLVKNSSMLVAATPALLPSSSRLLSKVAWSVLRHTQAPAPSNPRVWPCQAQARGRLLMAPPGGHGSPMNRVPASPHMVPQSPLSQQHMAPSPMSHPHMSPHPNMSPHPSHTPQHSNTPTHQPSSREDFNLGK